MTGCKACLTEAKWPILVDICHASGINYYISMATHTCLVIPLKLVKQQEQQAFAVGICFERER